MNSAPLPSLHVEPSVTVLLAALASRGADCVRIETKHGIVRASTSSPHFATGYGATAEAALVACLADLRWEIAESEAAALKLGERSADLQPIAPVNGWAAAVGMPESRL